MEMQGNTNLATRWLRHENMQNMRESESTYIWPTGEECDSAVENRRFAFLDSSLRNASLHEISPGMLRLNGGGSQHVCVYHVGKWIVRCFVANPLRNIYPPADIMVRYRDITKFLERTKKTLPFLVPHELQEQGIKIQGEIFPILKLPYIENSLPLGDFLLKNYAHRPTIELLASKWLEIIQKMEQHALAHGDLDLSNVLVRGNHPHLSLHLIDFDGMYIPDFTAKNMRTVDNGHTNFQPAQPGIRSFGPLMDRFSALVIYLSLCALKGNPALWEQCEAHDRCLLLGEEDFVRMSQSTRFPRLRQETYNVELQACLEELQASISQGRMPRSLDEISPGSHARSTSAIFPPQQPLPNPLIRHVPLPLDDEFYDDDLYTNADPLLASVHLPEPAPPVSFTSPISPISPVTAMPHTAASSGQANLQPPLARRLPVPHSASRAWIVVLIIVLVFAAFLFLLWLLTSGGHPQATTLPSHVVLLLACSAKLSPRKTHA